MHHLFAIASLAVALTAASCSSCSSGASSQRASANGAGSTGASSSNADREEGVRRAAPPEPGGAVAIFAGGCFWCMEKPFERLDGVESVKSGYTGGDGGPPSYDEVSAGGTGHAEAVRVVYDPDRIGYERLLEVFWHNIDPTQQDGQFCDHGSQYRTGIFVKDAKQRELAERSQERVRKRFEDTIHTEITEAGVFWIAEAYHQNYYRTHEARYERYRSACGRDARLRELWGDQAGH